MPHSRHPNSNNNNNNSYNQQSQGEHIVFTASHSSQQATKYPVYKYELTTKILYSKVLLSKRIKNTGMPSQGTEHYAK